jgi:TRAP-type transport system periplasmic protein
MEVGLIYFFSREPIYSIDDLKKRRIWQWTGDPMGQAFFDASGIAPVPLSIIDVYTSLSTGLIDTVYCPPLGAIALQWFTKTHYITNVPMANGIGALVVSSRFFQSLPQDLQKLLKSTGQKTGEQLIEVTRRDNRESLEILRSKGMEFILNPEDLDAGEVAEISKKAGESLTRSGYIPASTIHDINAWLAEFRALSHDHAPGNAVP